MTDFDSGELILAAMLETRSLPPSLATPAHRPPKFSLSLSIYIHIYIYIHMYMYVYVCFDGARTLELRWIAMFYAREEKWACETGEEDEFFRLLAQLFVVSPAESKSAFMV